MGVLANAGKNIEGLAAIWPSILHSIGRDHRQPMMFRQIKESPVDSIFPAQEVPLDFDKDILATESVDQKLREFRRLPGSARALACRSRRFAECRTNVGEIFLAQRFSGVGAGTSTRGACAPRSHQHHKSTRKLRQLLP